MAAAASAAGTPNLEAEVLAAVGKLGAGQVLNSYEFAKQIAGITQTQRQSGLSAEARKQREEQQKAQATRLLSTHNEVVGLFKSLSAIAQLDALGTQKSSLVELTGEAEKAADEGSPEAVLFALLPITQKEAQAQNADAVKNGMGPLKQMGFLKIDKNESGDMVLTKLKKMTKVKKVKKVEGENGEEVEEVEEVEEEEVFTDNIQSYLQRIEQEIAAGRGTEAEIEVAITKEAMNKLKARKLINIKSVSSFTTKAGTAFGQEKKKAAADLTSDMLKGDEWKKYTFKPRNFMAKGAAPDSGALHPLMKVRQEFRDILLQMGFKEMKTNQWVENSFWNFDALFVPQQHPARDVQDTFFIKDPAASTDRPADYLERVSKVHSEGDFGSSGYFTPFSVDETNKNILRTHTTAVSARKLYEIAQQSEFKPGKYFSIDRVFRNEEMDKTHLCEFHQIEGFIVDKNLSLGNMMAVLQDFFLRVGVKDLAFKPAYNPYTEPSMEIFGFHEGLGKQIEVGNSGVFRPEMLRPMGFPEDVTVIAWGLSLERPAMIRYGYNDIHELFGPKVSVKKVQDNAICRY